MSDKSVWFTTYTSSPQSALVSVSSLQSGPQRSKSSQLPAGRHTVKTWAACSRHQYHGAGIYEEEEKVGSERLEICNACCKKEQMQGDQIPMCIWCWLFVGSTLHSEDRSRIWQMKKILWQISSAISCKRIDIKRFIEDIKPGNKVNITFYTAVLHSSSKWYEFVVIIIMF